MNGLLIIPICAVCIGVALASDYGLYGTHDFFDDHGKKHGGHGLYDEYNKGFKKGFDEGGHGEYGSHKYGGWGKYAKGEEHGKYYGTEYDDGHEKGEHDYGYDHMKIGPIHEHIYVPHHHHHHHHHPHYDHYCKCTTF